MAKQAIASMNNYGSDQVVRATLQTYFGIRPNPTEVPPTVHADDQLIYDYVFSTNIPSRALFAFMLTWCIDTYEKIVSFAANNKSKDNLPSLFCDDSWLVKTDRAYELNTGHDLGMTLSTMFGGKITYLQTSLENWRIVLIPGTLHLGAMTYGYWSPLLMNYAAYTPGPRFCGIARTEAYTLYGRMQSITLCPWLFEPANKNMFASLSPYLPPNPIPAKPLQMFSSYGSTMLHELAHLCRERGRSIRYLLESSSLTNMFLEVIDHLFTGGPLNGQLAYGTRRCATLAQQDSNAAAHNADSYRWFATAMYLSHWDWSRAIGGLVPVHNQATP